MNEQILSQIETLATAYGREKIPSERIELYAEQLADMPVDHLAAVVQRVIRTRTFFPTVAELFETWSDLMIGPADPDGSLQWCLAEHKRIASRQEAEFWASDVLTRGLFQPKPELPERYADPVTAETVRLFGWQAIVETDPEFLPAMWRKTYAQARELVATRVKAGDLRLAIPEPSLLRQLRAVS